MGKYKNPDNLCHNSTVDLLDKLRAKDNITGEIYKIKLVDFASKNIALFDRTEEKNLSWVKWHNYSKRGNFSLLFVD